MKKSYYPDNISDDIFLKMNGRMLYEYALNHVPLSVKNCIEKARLSLSRISKVLIHQANEKMNEAILQRLFKLFDFEKSYSNVMPMTINKLGNNSVASLPILLDMILNNKLTD